LAALWERIHVDFFPGLFRAVMGFFKALMDYLERFLYTVDEWLRFRGGESTLSLILKAPLRLLWSVVAYLVRFCVTLLIEPQINPIKHFPVVTVAHKLLLPLIPTLASLLAGMIDPAMAVPVATAIIFSVPGFFGFLVWELKENWKLYRANRPQELQAVVIGGHGETLVRFLRPGFHSGTLPKLYSRMRRAEHRGDAHAQHRLHVGLHHVEQEIRHFVERECVNLLRQSKRWRSTAPAAGRIAPATNRVRVELISAEYPCDGAWLTFDLHEGRLLARLARTGWLAHLSPPQRHTFQTALAGLYRLAGVDAVEDGEGAREPIAWQAWLETWEADQAVGCGP
jgi:hypothetical protein